MLSRDLRGWPLLVRTFACATGVLAVAAALMSSRGGPDPTAHFIWIAPASIAAAAALVAIAGVWSAAAVYAAVFWCFHFGLVALLGIGYLAPADLSPWDESWLLGPFAGDAAMLGVSGMLAFASGASLMIARSPRKSIEVPRDGRLQSVHGYGFVGSLLVFAALTAWAGIVISAGGPAGFFTSYEDYLQRTFEFGTALSVVWPVLGCGLVMSITGNRAWHRSAALIAFGCFSLIGLPLGLRSEIMFPGVAALVALARSGRLLTPAKAGLAALTLLLVIPIVRQVRESGLRDLSGATVAFGGLDALAEMGGSLHPVEKVVRWHNEGEPYEKGATYWAPFERAIMRLAPGVRASAADDDLRIMNVLVVDRIGAIGFSPVAEAYRNFGPIGVPIVLALVGLIVGRLDTHRDPHTAVLLIATVYVPLLINIRNSFVSVPAQCALGIAIAVVVAAARHIAGAVISRPYARAAYLRSEI